jgi:hypothetical protein
MHDLDQRDFFQMMVRRYIRGLWPKPAFCHSWKRLKEGMGARYRKTLQALCFVQEAILVRRSGGIRQ